MKRAIETRRDARKTVGAASSSTKTRIQELNQQFQARMVRGSPTPIADAFADRDDTLRRDTPRPPRPAIATRFSLSRFERRPRKRRRVEKKNTKKPNRAYSFLRSRLTRLTRLTAYTPKHLFITQMCITTG